MKHVEGKVAFITGGASGIGFGMAQVFLKAGMKVIIADILQERLDEAARNLAQSTNRDFSRTANSRTKCRACSTKSFPVFRKDKKSIRAERRSRTVGVRRPPRPKRR